MLQGLAQHLPNHAQLLIEARHHNPFDLLGCHPVSADRVCVRAFVPNARSVKIQLHHKTEAMQTTSFPGLFQWYGSRRAVPQHYELVCHYHDGERHRFVDPYSFSPLISDYDLHLFGEGKHYRIYDILGAHYDDIDGVTGDVVVVGAEYVVDTIVLAFAKKVQVVIANQRREAVRIDKPMPFAIVIVTHQFVMLRDSTAASVPLK